MSKILIVGDTLPVTETLVAILEGEYYQLELAPDDF